MKTAVIPEREFRNILFPIRFTITGKLVSGKNRKVQSVKNGRAFAFKNPAVVAYERDFRIQVPSEYRGLRLGALAVPLASRVKVFYPSRRSDLDVNLIYDLLQHTGVIENDRYIVEKHEFAFIDADNPRAEIEIWEIP